MVDMRLSTWIVAGLAFLAVALATISATLLIEWFAERRRRRGFVGQLERLDRDVSAGATGSILRPTRGAVQGWTQRLSGRFSHFRKVEGMIEQAALGWTVQTYLVLCVGLAVALGLTTTVLGTPPLVRVIATIFGANLPYMYLRRRRAKRMAAFEENLPESIDLLGRAIRAGHPLTAGLRMVGDEAPEPISGEFRRVSEELRFGLGFEDSLLGMADRIPLVDVRIFVTAVLIQREVGGNLAEILDKLSDVIRQRFSIMRQLRTYTAQGRMSGYILGGLPIFLGLVLYVLNPENMTNFVLHPLGKIVLSVALVLQMAGYFWISRIVKIEV